MTGRVRKPSQTRRAAEELREMIIDGRLAAGTDHLETELAHTLGLSRTPVREALLVLEGQGLVEVRPRRGVRILPISPEDMAGIYDILTALESQAAGAAAAAGLGPSDLAGLRAAIAAMDESLSRDDRWGWARADADFHAELMRLGGNARAASIVAMLSDQVHRARMATLWIRPAPLRSNADHAEVCDAILARDAARAARVHARHRVEAKELLVGLLRRHHLRQL